MPARLSAAPTLCRQLYGLRSDALSVVLRSADTAPVAARLGLVSIEHVQSVLGSERAFAMERAKPMPPTQ
jgi:hypothetical protein